MERTLSNGLNGVTADEEIKPAIQLPQISGTKSTLQHQSGSSMGGNSAAANPRKLDSVARQSHESELAKNSGEDACHYLVRKNKLRNARLSQLDDAMQFNMTAKNVINPALEGSGKNNNSEDLEQTLYK